MNKSAVYILKKYFALILVGVVGLLTLNNALYTHFHKLANGELIVHAHPFSKSNQTSNPSKTHEHTKVELLVFDNLLLLFAGIILVTISSLVVPQKTERQCIVVIVKRSLSRYFCNRAPPTLFIEAC